MIRPCQSVLIDLSWLTNWVVVTARFTPVVVPCQSVSPLSSKWWSSVPATLRRGAAHLPTMDLTEELRNAAKQAMLQSNSNKPTELKQTIVFLASLLIDKLPIIEHKFLESDNLISNLNSTTQAELRLRDANIDHLKSKVDHLTTEVNVKDELVKSKDLLLLAQSSSPTMQYSFARVASSAPPMRSTPTNIYQVILKPKQIPGEAEIKPKDVRALFKAFYHSKQLREMKVTVVDIRTGPKAVSVLVETQQQVPLLISHINANDEINLMVAASELHKRNPTIKLDNIDPDIKPENLISQLIEDNQDKYKLESSEIYLLATKRPPPHRITHEPRPYTAFLVVSPALFNSIANQRLIVSHSATTAIETHHVNHCSHCLAYDHSTTKCPRNKRGNNQFFKRCFKCSAPFTSLDDFKTHRSTCNTESCLHCSSGPTVSTTRRDTSHRPLSNQCPIYRDKLNSIQSITNYDPSCSNLVMRANQTPTGTAQQQQSQNRLSYTPNQANSTSSTPSQLVTAQISNSTNQSNSPKQIQYQQAILNALSG